MRVNTFYLGSPASDTMLRCYDARDFTRIEIQLRRKRARRFWEELHGRDVEELAALSLGVIRAPRGLCGHDAIGYEHQ